MTEFAMPVVHADVDPTDPKAVNGLFNTVMDQCCVRNEPCSCGKRCGGFQKQPKMALSSKIATSKAKTSCPGVTDSQTKHSISLQ